MSYVVFNFAKCKKDNLTRMVLNFYTPSKISVAKKPVFKIFSAFLSDIISKLHRNSVNQPAHEAKVHDIMEAVEAIKFTTSGVLFCAINLEHVPKYCLGVEVTATITFVTNWLATLKCGVQQLKATNEPEATNASKFAPKDLLTGPMQVSQRQLRVRKQQSSVNKDEFQLVQYPKRSVCGIRNDIKPMSEPHITSLFIYRVNKDIHENDICHLLNCANIKVLGICVLSHELAKCISFKIVICHHDVD